MDESESETVPRRPEGPTPEQVLELMEPCEPYTVNDLMDSFDDVSRWTIQRRLDSLQEDGKIRKKKHTENRASYWVDG